MEYEASQGMSLFGLSFGSVIIFFVIIAVVFAILFIIKKMLPRILSSSSYFDQIIFQVRLPKDKPGDQEKETTVQSLREEIAVAETIFSSIGGLRAQRGFRAWLLGRNDQYSFEIVAANKQITFYAVSPRENARYVEQQINAYYPEAQIEEIEDYNIFQPQGEIIAGYLKTRRGNVFPIKTYEKQDADAMNSILNVMSKLDENESIVHVDLLPFD